MSFPVGKNDGMSPAKIVPSYDRLEKERIQAQIHYNLNFDAKYAFNLQMKKERHISFEFTQRRG